MLRGVTIVAAVIVLGSSLSLSSHGQNANAVKPDPDGAEKQINVNWLYGSYVPKDVPIKSLNSHQRLKLYTNQTYLTPGIYIKTVLFSLHDHLVDSPKEWNGNIGGFAKRLGNRQLQFIIQSSVSSVGNGMLGWEPRYDRCRCDGKWHRVRHAVIRNFVTYDRAENALRPQLMPYVGTFTASALATTWLPGNPSWQVKGYQAAITQVFVGAGINVIGEFGPEIARILRKEKAWHH
jgi:hypothetical protein